MVQIYYLNKLLPNMYTPQQFNAMWELLLIIFVIFIAILAVVAMRPHVEEFDIPQPTKPKKSVTFNDTVDMRVYSMGGKAHDKTIPINDLK